jgi:natural product biosynthesis luciferase-like monooxygenase protein/amino acid adenylation domain-containing protein
VSTSAGHGHGHTRRAECHGLPFRGTGSQSLVGALARAAEEFPDNGVVTVGADGRAELTTYGSLLSRAGQILARLRRQGCVAGETVVIYGLELPDFFPVLWACLMGGLVPLPICAAEPDAVPMVERVLGAWRRLGRPHVLTGAAGAAALLGMAEMPGQVVWNVAGWSGTEEAQDLDPSALSAPPGGEETALILMSSGSTGAAKLIPLTHAGLLEFASGSQEMLRWRPDERTLNWLPVDHSASLLLYHLLPAYVGCTCLHVPTRQVLADPLAWLGLLAEHKVNHSWAPTFGYQLVRSALACRSAPGWDLSGIRSLVCGGEQILPDVVDGFLTATARFGVSAGCFVPSWGMAETCTGITWGRYGEESLHRVCTSSLSGDLAWTDEPAEDCVTFVSVGRPAPGAGIRIVDGEDQVLPEGRIGRLQVRSNRVTPGYIGAGAAGTHESALQDDRQKSWFDTGDQAFIKDGEVVVTGREKDVIIVNGQNHYCHEIEAIAAAAAGVAGGPVAACGVPDPDAGSEALVVFFAPHDARPPEPTARAIGAELQHSLGLVPRAVIPLAAEAFPRTSGGKVRRAELVRLAAAVSTPQAPASRPQRASGRAGPVALVRRGVSLILGTDAGDGPEDVPFWELGLTSVTLVQLHVWLQAELGVTFPATAMFEYPSTGELAGYLATMFRSAAAAPIQKAPAPESRYPASRRDEPVAIIGMALRFPGARTPAEYWANLQTGKDCIIVFGPDAQRAAGLSDAEISDPDRRPVCGALDDIGLFDAPRFGMSPKEAASMEPAHRLFLECCYEALETAGYTNAPAGSRVGVFAGSGMNLYGYQHPGQDRAADLSEAMMASIGSQPDFLTTRVAYRLGLTGPAVGVQTACSTSLVAVHLAAQALRNGDADLALAGAAALHQPQETGYRVHPGSVLSPSGSCRPFDARADGTVGGNGVGVVLLKLLSAAIADGDPVQAVITGSAVNNDGSRKVGFTAPSVSGQADAVRTALARAGIPGDALSYVEAHGTGTALGDPVEFEALSQAIRTPAGRPGQCGLGSVKSSIGHLDTCSGMAGLIKVVLMLRHRTQVPTRNLARPNPALALTGSPFTFATDVRPLPSRGDVPLRAGVSSLGVGGTNAFVVVEEPPPTPPRPAQDTQASPVLVPLSGNSTDAVREMAGGLQEHRGIRSVDVMVNIAARPQRAVVPAGSATELPEALSGLAEGRSGACTTGRAPDCGDLQVALACCGQGHLRRGLARAAYYAYPVVREVLGQCEEAYRTCTGSSLLPALLDDQRTPLPAGLAQSALFSLQAALIATWRSWGLNPAAVLGQSLGEVAALAAAGALSVSDGVRFCARRGQLMAATAPGGMLALSAEPGLAEDIAGQAGLEVAVRGGGDRHVLSGDLAAVARGTDLLDQRGLPWRLLNVDVAFHSAFLDPVLPELAEAARACRLGPLAMPFISGVDGAVWPPGSTIDADYLVYQARRPVRLDLAFAAFKPAGLHAAVEIGPGSDLSRLGRRADPDVMWLAGDCFPAPEVLSTLYCQGAPAARSRRSSGGRRITLLASGSQRAELPRPRARSAGDDTAGPAADGTADREPLSAIRELTAARLGLHPEDVGADRTFVELGGDSLTLLALTRAISERYGVRIPIGDLFTSADTPRKLARTITIGGREPGSPPARAARHSCSRSASQKVATVSRPRQRRGCDFSIYFFGDYPQDKAADEYQNLLDAAEFADRSGFHGIWFPERHFHSFGALFPSPSVLGAALAVRTSRIRLNAGSVVLPLHDPIRVAEEWSMIDNLSRGRVGLCLASGWQANDFVFAPQNYGQHKEILYEHLATLRRLWAGERVPAVSGTGEPVEVATLPRPVQPMPPLFTAVVGNPESYRRAARNDLGVVTNLMSQNLADLGVNIELYRRTRAECGLDPQAGRVVVLVHTYLEASRDRARQAAFGPFCDYLRSSLSLFDGVANSLGLNMDLEHTHPEDVEFLLGRAFARYCEQRALIGNPESCRPVVEALIDAGADEIGCLVDFGLPARDMLAGLAVLDGLRTEFAVTPAVAAGESTSSALIPPRSPQLAPPPVPPPAAAPEPEPEPERGFPLSPAQRRLWILDKMSCGPDSYHEPRAILLEGPLDASALRGALTRVVARHPQLRAVFRAVDGEPMQFATAAVPVPCAEVKMEGVDPAAAARELVRADRDTVLDLETGPLLRARLARLGPERHLLFLLVHHIVFDSGSAAVFCRDLAAFYRAWPSEPDDLVPLPALGAVRTPADSRRMADGLIYWTNELADAPVLSLPADHPRSAAPSRRSGSLVHEFGANLTDAVAALAKEHGCTLFMALLGALGAVLGRLSGQEDVVLGTAMANRPAGTEDLIGMFVDTIVLRLDLCGEPSTATLLRRVRDRCSRAYEHRDVPFDKLVSVLNPERVAGANPLFQAMVEFEDAAEITFAPPRLRAEVLDVPSGRSAFDVSFLMTRHADGLRCTMAYDAGLFEMATIQRMLDYTEACLQRMVQEPAARLSGLTALTRQDQARLASLQGMPVTDRPACMHQLVEEQAERTPDAPALVGDNGTLTYRELNLSASRLASVLRSYGVRQNTIVGVRLPRGSTMIVALLAVLKAGGAYLPLDQTLPEDRLRFCIKDSDAMLLIADRDFAAEDIDLGSVPVHVVDDPGDSPREPLDDTARVDDMAYCIYTSGSAGPPKAVAVPHLGPVNLVRWQLRQSKPLRTLWWNSIAFDLSVQEIFTTLSSGAPLVLVTDGVRGDMAEVAEVMRRHGVQRVFIPFTPLKYLAEHGGRIPSLREIYVGGEQVVLTPGLRRFLDAHPGARVFNQYGPTEASVIVTSHEASGADGERLPIGRPISNVIARVLDHAGKPVPFGALGELCIGGAPLAIGYLSDPARTAHSFISDPGDPGQRLYRTGDLVRWRADGVLEFCCRTDDQLKIRGYRVSPGEVQWAVGQLTGLRDSAVVADRDGRGEPRLVAYVVPVSEPGPDFVARLREQLRARLPSHLIPERWVRLRALPIGPNGKLLVDRLPEPAGPEAELPGQPPETPTERRLHDLWCAELEVDAVSRDSVFFDCGGNSLTAVRLLSRVRDEFGCQLPLAEFMTEPTIEAMGRMLARLIPGER